MELSASTLKAPEAAKQGEGGPLSSAAEKESQRLKTCLALSLGVVVFLLMAIVYLSHWAFANALKAQDFDQMKAARDHFQRDLQRRQEVLQIHFSTALTDSLASSFAEAQSAVAAKNYGLALRELEQVQPWLQLGRQVQIDLDAVEQSFEEAYQALNSLSAEAPQKVAVLIQAVQELAREKKP